MEVGFTLGRRGFYIRRQCKIWRDMTSPPQNG
jgi:hypothetical protein